MTLEAAGDIARIVDIRKLVDCGAARRPPRLPPPEDQVRNAAGAGHGLEVEPFEQVLVGGPESLPPADLDRRDGDMHGVDEVRLEELPNGGDAASDPYVLPLGGVVGLPQSLRGRRIDEVERGVGQREAGSVMMGEDEDGRVEGRRVSPPPLPVEVLPRASLGPELVAAHDLGTNVLREVASEVVVQPSGSAGLGSVRPARGGERPRGQVGWEAGDATTSAVGMSEGRLEALAFARAEPVHRHAEVLHSQQLRNFLDPLSVCASEPSFDVTTRLSWD